MVPVPTRLLEYGLFLILAGGTSYWGSSSSADEVDGLRERIEELQTSSATSANEVAQLRTRIEQFQADQERRLSRLELVYQWERQASRGPVPLPEP